MDGWMYVCKISSTSKGKTLLSIENAMTYFRQTWYVGSGGTSTTHVVCRHRMRMLLNMRIEIPHLRTCSDWLITKKSNIQSSVSATLMKLGMWVVMGTSTTHVVCCHWMCIFNTSFAYLFWLVNNKKVKYPEWCMGYIDETWCVGSDGHKYYSCGQSSPNAHF